MQYLIVEDEPWVRRGLAELLQTSEPAATVRVACNVAEAFAHLATCTPDVAIVDLGLPDGSGTDVIRALRGRAPRCVSLAFTKFDDAPTVLDALRAGARGYLMKSTPSERILPLVREACAGGLPLSSSVAALVVEQALATRPEERTLTERETELLTLLARGATYAQAASALGIGLGTVQGYVKNIYAKLEVSSKAEAAVAAVRLGLV